MLTLILLSLLYFTASAVDITVVNYCDHFLNVYSHKDSMFKRHCALKKDDHCQISYDIPHKSGLIKTTELAEATLFEFTITNDSIWYDISVIPPGSNNCNSYDECYGISKRSGFNDPLHVKVDPESGRCTSLTCLENKCPDAYLYPFDDTKTHVCPLSTNITLHYCQKSHC